MSVCAFGVIGRMPGGDQELFRSKGSASYVTWCTMAVHPSSDLPHPVTCRTWGSQNNTASQELDWLLLASARGPQHEKRHWQLRIHLAPTASGRRRLADAAVSDGLQVLTELSDRTTACSIVELGCAGDVICAGEGSGDEIVAELRGQGSQRRKRVGDTVLKSWRGFCLLSTFMAAALPHPAR